MAASTAWIVAIIAISSLLLTLPSQTSAREILANDSDGKESAVNLKTTQDGDQREIEYDAAFGKKCRKMVLTMGKKQLKIFVNCTKQVQGKYPNKEDFTKHFQCAIRCTMLSSNIIDENMKVSNQTLQAYFDEQIPLVYHEIGHVIMGSCVKEWGPKLDPKDDTCQSYGNMGKCVQDNVEKYCTENKSGKSSSSR